MRVEINTIPPESLPMDMLSAGMKRHLGLSTISWVGRANGELVCIWGLIPPTFLSDEAYLWLNVTDKIIEHQFLFVRHSQRQMEQMLDTYPRIVGYVDVANLRAQRWIKWLGAEFGEAKDYRRHFVIERKPWLT